MGGSALLHSWGGGYVKLYGSTGLGKKKLRRAEEEMGGDNFWLISFLSILEKKIQKAGILAGSGGGQIKFTPVTGEKNSPASSASRAEWISRKPCTTASQPHPGGWLGSDRPPPPLPVFPAGAEFKNFHLPITTVDARGRPLPRDISPGLRGRR